MKIINTKKLTKANEYILETYAKINDISKNKAENTLIFNALRPKIKELQIEYDCLLRAYNGEILPQQHQFVTDDIEQQLQGQIIEAIGRSVSYLKSKHIKDNTYLVSLLSVLFKYEAFTSEEDFRESVNSFVYETTDKAFKKVCKNGFVYRDPVLLARRIISDWDKYWDDSEMYEVIISAIYCGRLRQPLTIWDAISVLYNCDSAVVNSLIEEVENGER